MRDYTLSRLAGILDLSDNISPTTDGTTEPPTQTPKGLPIRLAQQLTNAWVRYPRRLFLLGMVLSLLWTGRTTLDLQYVSRESARAELIHISDWKNLYYAAKNAKTSDIPHWFTGPWLYPDVGYYRPVTSILYFAEQRAFDQDFTKYNWVSYVLNLMNAGLLFLLAYSLFDRHPNARSLLAFLTVFTFQSTANPVHFAVDRGLNWWPAQNDVMGLTFGLAALFFFDGWIRRQCGDVIEHSSDEAIQSVRAELVEASRSTLRQAQGERYKPHENSRKGPGWGRWLAGTLISLTLSIWTKEMGYILLPVMLMMLAWRKGIRRESLKSAAPILLTVITLWVIRKVAVPNPWGPVWNRSHLISKALMNWFGSTYLEAIGGSFWPHAAAIGLVAGWLIARRLKAPIPYAAVAGIFGAGLGATYGPEGSTWMLLFQESSFMTVWTPFSQIAAIGLMIKYRKEPLLLALGMVMIVYVPILQYGGQHYFYWPGAFGAILRTVFTICCVRWLLDIIEEFLPGWSLRIPILAAVSEVLAMCRGLSAVQRVLPDGPTLPDPLLEAPRATDG